jgi:ABC-2 type transport system ATP-binding protein
METVIQTKKLSKYFGKARGIIDIEIEVRRGEIYGFIGPNGAGKSTTIRTLLGLIYPTSGSATIFGKDIGQFGPEIHEKIGYLPSEVFYYDDMKAIDLLRYSGSFYKQDQSVIAKRIQELASLLDLDLSKKIDDLSYGNKKKVGIIQGLLHEPELIILDEPTGGLDPLIQQKFFNLLREENTRGATILFSSHNLGEVQKLCDRVAIIKEGKIIKVETVSSLIEHNYKRLKLETASKMDHSIFSGLKGIHGLAVSGNSASFLYRGKIDALIKHIAKLELTNLLVEEPDLEEIFMHYYQTES